VLTCDGRLPLDEQLARFEQTLRRNRTLTEVLAREDDVAKKTKVAAAVKALPGYGPAKASAVLAQAGIPDMRRIGGLGEQQRRKLTEALGD